MAVVGMFSVMWELVCQGKNEKREISNLCDNITAVGS